MAEMIERTKVIGYVRVSTEQQASEGLSLDVQRARLGAYAEAMELDLVGIEEDAGFSAKNLNRPALKIALRALDEGLASGLLVVKLDRLTRRVLDLAHLIEGYFGERFSLLSVADSLDTRTAGGRLVLNVMASAAQWERETIGERVRETFQHLREQGVRLGHPPFGWCRIGGRDEHGRLVIREVPDEQETIRRAAQLRLQGCTLDEVATALTAEGRKPRTGDSWRAGALGRILIRAEVPAPTRDQVASRRRELGVWWTTARPPATVATDEAVELAVALREEGLALVEVARVLAAEGHKPLRGKHFHQRNVSALLRSVDPRHLRRRGHVRHSFQFGETLITSGDAASQRTTSTHAGRGNRTMARVIELRTRGCTLREIATRLTEEGHVPMHGGTWHCTTLSQMLRRAKVSIPERRPHGIDPFGFERVPSAIEGDQVEGPRPVPQELDTIKRAVALREEGRTLAQIAATLNQERRPTKRLRRWSSGSVSRVLHRVLDHEPTRHALADTLKGSDSRNLAFGWVRDATRGEDGRSSVRPVPSEQETIQRAAQLRRRGCSLPEIVHRLNSEGHATQRGLAIWNTGTVTKMLRRADALQPPAPIQSGRDPYGWERASGLDPKGQRGLRPVPAEQTTNSTNDQASQMWAQPQRDRYGARAREPAHQVRRPVVVGNRGQGSQSGRTCTPLSPSGTLGALWVAATEGRQYQWDGART
jgi:site-specific DNA recombinase